MNTGRGQFGSGFSFLAKAKGAAPSKLEVPSSNRDILPALALVWLASAVRVAGAIWLHQTFGVEATLALLALVAIPWMAVARKSERDIRKLN